MFLIKLAVLNIGRNARRSIITVLAIAVGLAALIFLWGFSDGTIEQSKKNIIRLFTGHIQIHAPGFDQNMSPELTLPDRSTLLEKLADDPQVTALTERVKCEALVGTSEHSRGILLIGIDPAREGQITDLKKHIKEGEFLSQASGREVMLGDLLAEKLKLKTGDKAVVLTQAIDGTLAGYSFRVKGIIHTGSRQVDELSAFVTLGSARELLDLGDESHELVLLLSQRKMVSSFVSKLKNSLDRNAYEILSWDEIVPEPLMWVKWYETMMRTVFFTVMIVIGVGIMNTVLMSVFERTKELGVMLAIGTSPKQVIALILLETLVLEALGIILGLIAGYLVVFYFGQVGISFHELEQALSQSYVSTVTYTWAEPMHVVESVITLLAITTFVGLYPAWRAGRMEPVKAIYHS